jgi:hypothetical protein
LGAPVKREFVLPAAGFRSTLGITAPASIAVNFCIFSIAISRLLNKLVVPLKNGILIVTYCILETGSKQYRVSAGDTLEIELLAVEAGQPVTFDRVLLVNNEGKLAVGSPAPPWWPTSSSTPAA